MLLHKLAFAFLLTASAAAAQPPVPDLRIEAVAGGSVLYVKNRASQPLTAFLIELVDYPGSSFWFLQDDPSETIAPGIEKRIPVSSMTVGAAPDYVKIQAAIFADGATAGIPQRVGRLVERRRAILDTTRELIERIQKPQDKLTLIADLKQWSDSLRSAAGSRYPENLVPTARRMVIDGAITRLGLLSPQETLELLRKSEASLAAFFTTSSPRL